MKGRLLLISSDKTLIESYESACAHRGVEALHAVSAAESSAFWRSDDGPLTGVVADSISLREKERRYLIDLHRPPDTPGLILLDPPQSAYPLKDAEPLMRLPWPIDPSFLDLAQLSGDSTLFFLVNPTLYLTGLVQERLREVGIAAKAVDNPQPLMEAMRTAPPAIIIRWSGNLYQAEEWCRWIKALPKSGQICLVDSRGPIHAAEVDIGAKRPAFLPRKLMEIAVDLLLGRPAVDPMSFGRILLVDGSQQELVKLTQNLMEDGYDVSACGSAADALERTRGDTFFVAVISAALDGRADGGFELAQKLREQDSDLKLILTVDQYPLKDALRGVTQMVEVGLDDCLLKPLEPSRLKFSITRALDRRRLRIENMRLMQEFKATHEKLEQLTDFQSKFFAMVAHDIKNPLNAVIGYADLLEMKAKSPDLAKPIHHIRAASHTLDGLVSDLVDFAAIESGKLRVNIGRMNLLEVISEVGSRVKVAADKREIKLHVATPKELPPMSGDPLRIGQVVQNLCTNAIQYTPKGGAVYITLELQPPLLKISVRDTGIGISKEDLPRIFQRFFQAKNAQVMRNAGFGLGLKIAQEIVKAHGGEMGVDSTLGKGSVFHFTLPLTSSGA
ncbi:MAG: hybrid sensor histidine kinase/response regulator [Elusimicrobiota bacterium]